MRPTLSSVRRAVSIGAALVVVVVLAACDPPDGRDLSLVVTDPPSSIEEAASTTVTAALANVGTAPATGTVVTVLVPLGVDVTVEGTQPCSEPEYAELVDQLARRCPVGAVGPGEVVDVTVSLVGEHAGVPGHVVLSATSSGGGEPANGGAPATVSFPFSVLPRDGVDLHVEGGGLEQPVVAPASEASLTTVVNRGSAASGPVTVTQQLVGPVTVAGTPTLARADGGATGSCVTAGLTVTCTTDAHDVAPYAVPGDRWVLSVPVGTTASFPASFTVTHAASSPDPEPMPDRWPSTATVQGRAADLYLGLDGPTDVPVGSTFEVSVADMSHAIWGPYYSFAVPPTMRLESPCQGTGSFSCTVNTPVTTFRLTALSPGGPHDFFASFQAEGIPSAGGSLPIEVIDPAITSDVHPSATPPDFGLLGEPFTVEGEVRTAGATAHQDVVVEAEAPAGTVVLGAQWGPHRRPCDVSRRTIRCEVGDVDGHSQVPFEVDLLSYRTGPVAVAVGVTSATPQDEPDPWPDAIVAEVPVRTPFTDLELTATQPASEAVQGLRYDMTYRPRNRGSDPATGVVLTVVVPDGFTIAGVPSGCTSSGPTVTCPIGTLGPGEARQVIVRTWAGPPGASSIEATVVGDQPEPDPDPHPNAVSTPVDPLAPHGDLAIELSTSSGPHVVGEQAGFSVVVRNDGPSMVPNVRWRIVVPDGWRLDSVDGSYGYLCTVAENTAECGPRPTLWLTSLSLVVRLTPLEVGSDGVLTATVWGELPDPDPTSNSAELGLSVVPVSADLGIEPWQYGDAPDRFTPGGSGRRSYEISNAGPALASDVVISGSVPEAATITGATGGELSCTWQAHEFTCTRPTLLAGFSVVLQLDLAWANVPGPLVYDLAVASAQPEPVPEERPNTLSHQVISSAQPVGVEGRVVDPDGSPVAGATVRLYAETDGVLPTARVDTGPDGTFSFVGRPLGTTYRVSITPPSGRGWTAEWYQDAPTRALATPLALSASVPLHVIEVRLG